MVLIALSQVDFLLQSVCLSHVILISSDSVPYSYPSRAQRQIHILGLNPNEVVVKMCEMSIVHNGTEQYFLWGHVYEGTWHDL